MPAELMPAGPLADDLLDRGRTDADDAHGSGPHWWRWLILLLVVAVIATAVVLLTRRGTSAPAAAAKATATATVVRRDLVVTDSLPGELAFAAAHEVYAGAAGVVTSVAPAGTVLPPGGTLYAVNLEPSVLLTGAVPAYRALDVGAADGPDVQQLEQALTDLRYAADLTVDEHFSDATANAVERWETDLGRADPDGTVALGDVVFGAGPVRVAQVQAAVGSQVQPGTVVVSVTGTGKVVDVELATSKIGTVDVGSTVTVTLPDDTSALGTVTSIGTEQHTDPTDPRSAATVSMVVTLADAAAAAAFDSGSVDVVIEESRVSDALTVPVDALVALAGGGYAVQVVDGAAKQYVAVTVGRIAEGFAQITGQVVAGATVVVPA